jgi:hypothetical protein
MAAEKAVKRVVAASAPSAKRERFVLSGTPNGWDTSSPASRALMARPYNINDKQAIRDVIAAMRGTL